MNRLRRLREEMGKSQNELSKLWNTSPSSISQWENGVNEMDYKTLIMASNFYGRSIDYILGNDSVPEKISKEEIEIIKVYRSAPADMKRFITTMIREIKRMI